MWCGFFDAVLEDDSLFGGKVPELCQGLGKRGQAVAHEEMRYLLSFKHF